MSPKRTSTATRPTRCIFCLQSSENSKSIEHIVPESLGHNTSTLPVGMVCDSCNNYFGRKVEGVLLNTSYFKALRFRNNIETKKNRPTSQIGIIPKAKMLVNCYTHPDQGFSIGPRNEPDSTALVNFFQKNKTGRLYIPFGEASPDKRLFSRLLAKMAIEAIALRLYPNPKWEDFIYQNQLDEMRNYARHGGRGKTWEYSERRIYPEDRSVFDDGIHYQILNEYDFLWTKRDELYFIFCLFGIEYAINMGGNSIEGFEEWLNNNNGLSPLQSNKEGTFE